MWSLWCMCYKFCREVMCDMKCIVLQGGVLKCGVLQGGVCVL